MCTRDPRELPWTWGERRELVLSVIGSPMTVIMSACEIVHSFWVRHPVKPVGRKMVTYRDRRCSWGQWAWHPSTCLVLREKWSKFSVPSQHPPE